MRKVEVQIPTAAAAHVVRLAEEREGLQSAVLRMEQDGERLVIVHLPNDAVGSFVEAVAESVDEASFSFAPASVLPIRTPLSDVDRQVHHVDARSTLELVLGALQSLGTWKGMLFYAAFSGLVAAYGVTLNASYLLTAAMLIAPMGAPAMVCVVAASIGDARMFGRGALRFVVALAVLVTSAVVFGLVYGLHVSTPMMESVTSISQWTVLLALVGGAAGAQSQVQSERDSLVTGTATGFLIAVSLSPASAVLGLGAVLGRWDYVGTMAFVLTLTFFGIVVGGWLALRVYHVHPGQTTLSHASSRARWVLAGAALAVLVAAVAWQSGRSPGLQKADRAHDAIVITREAVRATPAAHFVSVTTVFTRPDLDRFENETLFLDVVVERASASLDADAVETAVRDIVAARVVERIPNVTPLVAVTVLPARAGPSPGETP